MVEIEELSSRSACYAFLSRIYRTEIDEGFLEKIKNLPKNDESAGFKLIVDYINSPSADMLLDLARDYAKCFCGAGLARNVAAFPYESVYTSENGLMEQEALDKVNKIYAKYSLVKSEEIVEPGDHIAFELEFLSFLLENAINALNDEDTAKYSQFMEEHDSFLKNHLLNWVPNFCKRLEAHAQTDFYRGTAKFTVEILIS
jgi:anaerobic sulfite reductase subunit A